MELQEALKIYGSKAPVCLCDFPCAMISNQQYCGPQKQAIKAEIVIEKHVAITTRLEVSILHAWNGEGREEFDEEWKLFLKKNFPNYVKTNSQTKRNK